MSIMVSVVIPTCRRPDLLDRCLAAVAKQNFDPACYEVIVVDDAPEEATRAVVLRWAARTLGRGPVIGYLPNRAAHGPAAARNQGWRGALGDVVAFTDDDTVPAADWLKNGSLAFCGEADAVWGKVVMPATAGGPPTDYELDAKGLERAEFVTANCFCLKSLLERLDGFDERFELAWREDADLYFRLIGARARIVHVPEAVVVHPVRPAPWGVSLRQQKKVLFDALLFKKHPNLYREKIRRSPRWDYYAIVVAMLAAAAGIAAGQALLAWAAGGVWAMLTGRFFWQRLRRTSKRPDHILEMLVTSILIPPLAVFWRAVGALRFGVRFV